MNTIRESIMVRSPMSSDAIYTMDRMDFIRRFTLLPSGHPIGEFVIDSVHARGRFATVYRARSADNRPVAVKVLHPHMVAVKGSLPRFRREVEAIESLRHPNIVASLGLGQLPSGPPYFAMEWLEGQTLDSAIEESGAFSVEEAFRIARDLCSALGAAHGVGIIHRDIKCKNVVLQRTSGECVTKLVDFGVAKLVGTRGEKVPALTAPGDQVGTPQYMAPEQILGETGQIDRRTDLYAVGVLLYRMVTGTFPYAAGTLTEIEGKHLHAPIPRASSAAPVSRAVDEVIAWCLEKRRERRPASAEDLAEALKRAADGESLSPRASTEHQVIVRVEGTTTCRDDDIDDELLDALEDRLAEQRQELLEAGFELRAEDGNSLVVAKSFPDGETTRAGRVLGLVREFAAKWEGQTTDSRLLFSVTTDERPTTTTTRATRSGPTSDRR